MKFYFWSELLKPKYVQIALKSLANHRFGLNLAVRPALFEKVEPVVKTAEDYGVDLAFWPLLSYSQGYWVNAWNFAVQKQWISKLMHRYPSVHTYLLDLEAPLNFKGIKGKILTEKLNEIRPWKQVRNDLEKMIEIMHQNGKIVISTNYPTNPSRRRKQGTPRPRNADFYSYMVYTSLFAMFGNDISKDNVVNYAGRKILKAHGAEKGIMDLGLTSAGVLPKFLPTTTLDRIVSEVGICKYLGFKRVHIFALDEIRQDCDHWMEKIKQAPAHPPPLERDSKNSGIIFQIFRKILLNEELIFE